MVPLHGEGDGMSTKFGDWCDGKMLTPTMENADKFADELLRESRIRTEQLEQALKRYTHCRHACIDCFCTKEAREVLEGIKAA